MKFRIRTPSRHPSPAGAMGAALALVAFSVFGTVPVLSASAPTPPVIVTNFRKSMAPLTPSEGNWAVADGLLEADNLAFHGPLPRQFASAPTGLTNEVVLARFTLIGTPNRGDWRVGVFVHGSSNPTNPQKWALIIQPGKLSLLDENTAWIANTPFSTEPGETLNMVLAVNRTTVQGRVWPAGQPEPTGWTITGTFPPNRVQLQGTAAGIYVANADADFQSFEVMVAPPALTVTPDEPGGIFVPDVPVHYTATLSNTSGRGAAYRVQYTLSDANGNPVASGSVPVTVPADGVNTVTVPLQVPRLGYYQVAFTLTTPDGFPLETGASQALAAVPAPTEEPPVLNPVGMNGNLTWIATYAQSGVASDAFQALKNQGIGWYRLNLNSERLKPPGKRWNFAGTDRLVADAQAHQLNLLGLLTAWPDHARPFGAHPTMTFQAALTQYLAYVKTVVERYEPGGAVARAHGWKTYGVTAWELWNEPVSHQFWGGTPEQYAELAVAAAREIRQLEPRATVLAYADQPQNLIAGGPQLFSGLSLHYYPGGASPENTTFAVYQSVTQNLQSARALGGSLWITETGWSTKVVPPDTQAAYWDQTVLDSLAAGAKRVMLFTQIYPGSGFSEERSDLTPKPDFVALAALDRRIAGFSPLGRLNLGPALTADAFTDGSSTLVALFSDTTTGSLTLASDVSPIIAYDWMDNPIQPNGFPGASARLVVPIGPDPVYLDFVGQNLNQAEAVLNQSTESGIAPFQVNIQGTRGPDGLPTLTLSVTNGANRAQSGTLTVLLPDTWAGTIAGSTATAVYDPSAPVGPLAPGASSTITVQVTKPHTVPNAFTVTATVAPSSGLSPTTATAEINLNAPARTRRKR